MGGNEKRTQVEAGTHRAHVRTHRFGPIGLGLSGGQAGVWSGPAADDRVEWGYAMSFFDRVLGRSTTPTLERPTAPTATPTVTPSTVPGVDEEQLIEIARRAVPPTETPTHFFICSGNRSLIEAYDGLFRVAAPGYGGKAGVYRAESDTLRSRQADATSKGLRFEGKRSMGSTSEPADDIAGVLGSLGFESTSGGAYVAYVTVGPKGVGWVKEAYTRVMGDALRQGILPFSMFETGNAEAAEYLLASFVPA